MKQLYPVYLEQECRYMFLLLTSSNPCVNNLNDANFSAELTQRKSFPFSFVMTRRKEKKELLLFDEFKRLLFSLIERGLLFSHLRSRSF